MLHRLDDELADHASTLHLVVVCFAAGAAAAAAAAAAAVGAHGAEIPDAHNRGRTGAAGGASIARITSVLLSRGTRPRSNGSNAQQDGRIVE